MARERHARRQRPAARRRALRRRRRFAVAAAARRRSRRRHRRLGAVGAHEEVELAQLAGTSPQTPARDAAAAAEDSAEVSSEPLMRSAAPDSAAPAAVDDLDNVARRRNLSPQPLPPPGAVPLPPPLTGGGGGSGDGRPSLESHPSDVPTPVHVREAEPQYLAAAMRRADSAREAEEPHAASDANKLQRLLTLYDEFRRCTSIDKARLKLNALLQQRASAKPDSAEARRPSRR